MKRPSDLFNEPASQSSPPASQPRTSSPLASIIIVILVAVLFFAAARQGWFGGGDDRRQDRHEQKQDDKKQDDKRQAVVRPGYLYVIRERQFPVIAENESVAMIAEFCSKNAGTEFRDLDDDEQTSAKYVAHAKSKGIDPPCVVFKPKDGELSGAIKLPTKEADLMEVFK